MGKVYSHKRGAPDKYLGRVEPENGKVYRHRPGPDEYLGRVDLANGKIYRHRPGLDDYLGEVHLDDGKVYCHRVGPDRYVAEIKSNGRIYRHKPGTPDDYLGRVKDMHSLAEGGAAFFLLLLPVIEGEEIESIEGAAEATED